ncbi:unnamed protein product [Ectocarpus sp. CCAP 1310/34]|nr:unnamed protein product [Ectocarpus sp. CCAP 1310/34]
MGCVSSSSISEEPPARTVTGSAPLDGRTFADIIIRFMTENREGPSLEQGELLEYIRNQGTSADEGDGMCNKTPIQFASQHRLIVWLMFIIRRLNVFRPEFLGDALRDMNAVDPRLRRTLKGDDLVKYDAVVKLLTVPATAVFLEGHYRGQTKETEEALTAAFKALKYTAPEAREIPNEPPALAAWMMASTTAKLAIEAYTGGLWGLFTSCLKLAEIVKRWSARDRERLAWRAFAEAHRGMIESARTLARANAMADDPGIALSPILSKSIKNSLKAWTGSVQDLVERLCKEVEAAIANPSTTRDELKMLMAKSTVEVLEKRALMNVELEKTRRDCDNTRRIYSLQTTVENLKPMVDRFLQLDEDLKESLQILKHGREVAQREIDEALDRVLKTYLFDRGHGNGTYAALAPDLAAAQLNIAGAPLGAGNADAPVPAAASPSPTAGVSSAVAATPESPVVAPAPDATEPAPAAASPDFATDSLRTGIAAPGAGGS